MVLPGGSAPAAVAASNEQQRQQARWPARERRQHRAEPYDYRACRSDEKQRDRPETGARTCGRQAGGSERGNRKWRATAHEVQCKASKRAKQQRGPNVMPPARVRVAIKRPWLSSPNARSVVAQPASAIDVAWIRRSVGAPSPRSALRTRRRASHGSKAAARNSPDAIRRPCAAMRRVEQTQSGSPEGEASRI